MPASTYAALLAAAASTAYAHGIVSSVTVNGAFQPSGNIDYTNTPAKPINAGWATKQGDLGFTSLTDTTGSIVCAQGAVPGNTDMAVTAGSTVTFNWDHPGAGERWPASHKGPTLTYLAKCPGTTCAGVDPSSLQFFKIQEEGITAPGNPATWSSDKMIANNGSVAVTFPAGLPNGAYVARHETIALHSAGSSGGAQFYPQCTNVLVSGGSGTTPTTGVAATALYNANDPGVLINIYQQLSSYTIPGPALVAGAVAAPALPGAGGSGAAPAAPASSAPASTKASSSAAAPTSSKAAASTSSAAKPTTTSASKPATTLSSVIVSAASATTSAAAAPSGSATGTSTKAIPDGTTLNDLLAWFKIVLNQQPAKRAELAKRVL